MSIFASIVVTRHQVFSWNIVTTAFDLLHVYVALSFTKRHMLDTSFDIKMNEVLKLFKPSIYGINIGDKLAMHF